MRFSLVVHWYNAFSPPMTAVRHEPIILIGVVSETNKHTYVTGGTQRKIYTAALQADLCHINTVNMILIVFLWHVPTCLLAINILKHLCIY